MSAIHIEKMISRKKALFGNDLRHVSDYESVEKDGEWRLRAEARAPAIKGSIYRFVAIAIWIVSSAGFAQRVLSTTFWRSEQA